jgi:hypothetical protein
VYGDIVQGMSQLVGQINQGKRGIEDAEFRRESLDFRQEQAGIANTQRDRSFELAEDQFEQNVTQSGIANTQRDRSFELAEGQFEHSVEQDYYSNVLKFASEGQTFTGAAPEGAVDAPAVQQQGAQLVDQVQYVTATQRLLDNSQAKGKSGTFDQAELKRFMPHLANNLRKIGEANPDFDLKGKINDDGHIVFSVDEATAASVKDEGMRKILTGESPVTPAMLASQLGQDIAGLGKFGKYGKSAMGTANAVYDKSRSTSATAQAAYMNTLSSRITDRGLTTTTSAISRVGQQAKRWAASPNADIAAATAAENHTSALLTDAYRTLQTEVESATSEKEISQANSKYQQEVISASSKYNKLAGDAQNLNDFEQTVSSGALDGSFNNDAYAKPWGAQFTKGVGRANTEATLPVLRQQVTREGMNTFIDAEVATMMAANSSLERGDARDQASTAFTNKVATYIRDARLASAEGLPLAKDSMQFLKDYAPEFLATMRLNIVTSYMPEETKTVTDEFATTFE